MKNFPQNPCLMMAPMVDLSHEAYRDLVRSFGGCDLFYSEMLNSRILPSEKPGESLYLKWHDTNNLILQILGNDPDLMRGVAAKLLSVNPWGIDINMGCWLKKITVHGWGLALMKDINLAQKVVEAVRSVMKIPLSVKIRIGYSLDKAYLLDFASMLEGSGVDFIVLHARTAIDGLNRPARWEYIAMLKEHLKIPVIGNGDVKSASHALALLKQTRCDGIMIARQALRQPWIFRDVKAALDGESLHAPPDLKDVMITLTHFLEKYFPHNIAVKRFNVAIPWLAENLVFGHYLVKELGKLHSMYDIRLKIQGIFADGIS